MFSTTSIWIRNFWYPVATSAKFSVAVTDTQARCFRVCGFNFRVQGRLQARLQGKRPTTLKRAVTGNLRAPTPAQRVCRCTIASTCWRSSTTVGQPSLGDAGRASATAQQVRAAACTKKAQVLQLHQEKQRRRRTRIIDFWATFFIARLWMATRIPQLWSSQGWCGPRFAVGTEESAIGRDVRGNDHWRARQSQPVLRGGRVHRHAAAPGTSPEQPIANRGHRRAHLNISADPNPEIVVLVSKKRARKKRLLFRRCDRADRSAGSSTSLRRQLTRPRRSKRLRKRRFMTSRSSWPSRKSQRT